MKLQELVKRYNSGEHVSKESPDGNYSTDVFFLTFNDSAKAVIKTDYPENIDKELMVVPFATMLKVRIPEIHRINDTTVIMEMISGHTAGHYDENGINPRYPSDKFKAHCDRRRMTVMDCLIFNGDRHRFNWMIDDNGKVWAIDHNYAFNYLYGSSTYPAELMHDFTLADIYTPEEIEVIDAGIKNLSMKNLELQLAIQERWELIKAWDRKALEHCRQCGTTQCSICQKFLYWRW